MASAGTRGKKADLKVVVIGHSGVGKTALMHQFVYGQFEAKEPTIGVSFVLKEWKNVHLAIWDTAGSEKYSPLSSFYSRDAAAALIVYDVTDRKSFDEIGKWWSCLENAKPSCHVVVVGNKYDLVENEVAQAAVTAEEGRKLASSKGAKMFFETSAKTGLNVDRVFDNICENLLPETFNPSSPTTPSSASIKLPSAGASSTAPQEQKCCD